MENSDKTEGEERPGAEMLLENETLPAEDKADQRIGEKENQTSDDEYFSAGSSANGDESTGDTSKRINFSVLMGMENKIIEASSTSELIEGREIESDKSLTWTSSEEEDESTSTKDSSESEESDTSEEVLCPNPVGKTDSKFTNDLLDCFGSDADLCVKEDKKVEVIRSGFDRRFRRIIERIDHLLEKMNELATMDLLRMQMFVSKYEAIILDIEELEADITSLQNLYEDKLREEFQVHLKAKRSRKEKQAFYQTVVWNLMELNAEVVKMKNEFHDKLKFVLMYIESKASKHDLEMKVFELESQKHREHLKILEEVSSDDEVEFLYVNPNFNGKQEKLHKINILSGKGRHQRVKYSWTRKESDGKKNTLAGLDLVAEAMYRNFNKRFKKESSPIETYPIVSSINLPEEKLVKMKSRDREHLFKVMENNGFKCESVQMIPLLLQDLKSKKKSNSGCLGFLRRIFNFKS